VENGVVAHFGLIADKWKRGQEWYVWVACETVSTTLRHPLGRSVLDVVSDGVECVGDSDGSKQGKHGRNDGGMLGGEEGVKGEADLKDRGCFDYVIKAVFVWASVGNAGMLRNDGGQLGRELVPQLGLHRPGHRSLTLSSSYPRFISLFLLLPHMILRTTLLSASRVCVKVLQRQQLCKHRVVVPSLPSLSSFSRTMASSFPKCDMTDVAKFSKPLGQDKYIQ
jgi:hypothetical protein